MDRRHRALLSLLAGGLCVGAAVGSASPPPAPATTPWVQATPGFTPAFRPGPIMPLNPLVPVGPEMQVRGRLRNAVIDARPEGPGVAERLARMTPEEREAFNRNLHLWQQMPPEERQALRMKANERNREEVQNAIKESGLQLSPDQREVFALRYLQERRKLERDIQEQANAERARRLPEILQQLRSEFGGQKAAASPSHAGTPGASPGR